MWRLLQPQALIRGSLGWARFPMVLVLTSDASNGLHRLVEELRGSDAQSQSLISHIQVSHMGCATNQA